MEYNWPMAHELLFQTNCGASGDMILAAMIDLLDAGDEFKKRFRKHRPGRDRDRRRHGKKPPALQTVTISAPLAGQDNDFFRYRNIHRRRSLFRRASRPMPAAFSAAIFKAEAEVHGEELKNVHLHEIGADDSLVDILGFCWLWEKLDCCPMFFTTLVTGRGDIQTRHGLLPVPPPAVLHLVQGLEYRSGDIEGELLTPTGAAILTACGTPGRTAGTRVKALKTGCGCGHKTFAQVPNLLRAILSEKGRPGRQ